jgi:hypothetical protein
LVGAILAEQDDKLQVGRGHLCAGSFLNLYRNEEAEFLTISLMVG